MKFKIDRQASITSHSKCTKIILPPIDAELKTESDVYNFFENIIWCGPRADWRVFAR